MVVFQEIPHRAAEGVYTSPSWMQGNQLGGFNTYILMPGSTFHLLGYGGVELVSVQGSLGNSLPGHVRWYVGRSIIEYGLTQPATDDNTLGDWVEQLGAFKHFGLGLAP